MAIPKGKVCNSYSVGWLQGTVKTLQVCCSTEQILASSIEYYCSNGKLCTYCRTQCCNLSQVELELLKFEFQFPNCLQ